MILSKNKKSGGESYNSGNIPYVLYVKVGCLLWIETRKKNLEAGGTTTNQEIAFYFLITMVSTLKTKIQGLSANFHLQVWFLFCLKFITS